ncbi:MAG: lipopolysaccharide biosynthesis protein [Acidobacteria bacterium]|nr:MAG: lipopolysaccharide biosynthesis protein [Acidobacteriota bacterium]
MADPTAERPLHIFTSVRDRTVKGVVAMFLRQFVVMPVGLLATILLARLLHPDDFGIYAIANFWIYLIVGFRDLGFSAALIQQRTEPTSDEWNTMFTFQCAVVSITVVGLYVLAPPLTQYYRLDPRMVWVIRGLSFILLIGLLGSVPNAILERRLAYETIARIEVAAMLTFHLSAVILAILGFGVWSFIDAAIASEILRAILLFRRSGWRPGFAWKRAFLASALKFGGLYQLGGLTSLLRDNIAPLLAGPLFGPTAVGYLKWAERTTYLTSQVFTQIVTRVSFPSLSRLQDQREEIGRAVEKMLRYLMLATIPTLTVAAALIPWIIHLVFTDKWQPAIIAYYWLTLRMIGGNITTPFIGVLNALGRVTTSLRILAVWTGVDWMLALTLTPLLGFNGVAVAYAIGVAVPVVWLLGRIGAIARLNLKYTVGRPLVAGILVGAVTRMMGHWITDLLSLVVVALLGLFFYPLSMTMIEGQRFLGELRREAQLVRRVIWSKSTEWEES